MRTAIQMVGLIFVIFFAAMTLYVLATDGFTILVFFSLVILGFLGLAVWGAITGPPDDRR